MWTANLDSKNIENNYSQMVYVVSFTDGTDSFTRKYVYGFNPSNVNQLKNDVRKVLNQLNTPKDIAVGQIDVSEPTLTAAEQAKVDWFSDYSKIKNAQDLISLGIITGTETAYVNLLNKVKADFKPAYVNEM